jgi:ABC-type dipeptide/oligopeptide/nickel transport system permease subunit
VSVRRGILADSRALFGLLVLAAAVLAALAAPWLAGDPLAQRDVVATRFLPPLASDLHGQFHLLGTDRFGRDVWARLLHGARLSLGVGALSVLVSVLVGVAIGAAAGRCSHSPTSRSRCPGSCSCSSSRRSGSRAPGW